jgi:hypothetical protein
MPHLDPDGYLRVGIIAARNEVSRADIAAFLDTATPVFAKTFAPVKVIVAGAVCDLLDGVDGRFVELRGNVNSAEDFYRTVDCIAVPMRASASHETGLREALAFGLPVLAIAHAFEGYEPADRMHALSDFTEMADALADLAFAPRKALDVLARASYHTLSLKVLPAETVEGRKTLVLLGKPNGVNIAMAAAMARAWNLEAHVVCGLEDDVASGENATRAGDYVGALLSGRKALPHLALDLSAGSHGLVLCRALLEGLQVPTAMVVSSVPRRTSDPARTLHRVATECELWSVMRELAIGPADGLKRLVSAA